MRSGYLECEEIARCASTRCWIAGLFDKTGAIAAPRFRGAMQTPASPPDERRNQPGDEVDPVIIRSLVGELQVRGLDASGLLEASGLSSDDLATPDLRVTGAQTIVAIERALGLTNAPELLGLQIGCAFNLIAWGPIFLGFQACEDRDELLDLAAQHMPTVAGAARLVAEHGTGGTTLLCISAEADPPVQRFVAQLALATLSRACARIVGPGAGLRSIEFRQPAPAGAERYARALGLPIMWSRPGDCLVMDRQAARVESADRITLLKVRAWLDRPHPTGRWRSEVEVKVREAIAKAGGSSPSLGQVAASLHLTDRTLRRRLASASLKYSELVDDHRRSRVMNLMATDVPLDQIARAIGFSDVRSLRRAVIRWTGEPLSAARRRARGPAPTGPRQPKRTSSRRLPRRSIGRWPARS